jgi:hypothetical protein
MSSVFPLSVCLCEALFILSSVAIRVCVCVFTIYMYVYVGASSSRPPSTRSKRPPNTLEPEHRDPVSRLRPRSKKPKNQKNPKPNVESRAKSLKGVLENQMVVEGKEGLDFSGTTRPVLKFDFEAATTKALQEFFAIIKAFHNRSPATNINGGCRVYDVTRHDVECTEKQMREFARKAEEVRCLILADRVFEPKLKKIFYGRNAWMVALVFLDWTDVNKEVYQCPHGDNLGKFVTCLAAV